MEFSYMLNQMCHEVLANADINAIRKARGFTQKETESRSTFESFFLSSIGLKNVIAALSEGEIAVLHLLDQQKRPVDISFFERLYHKPDRAERYYYSTFTQQYRDVLDAVKKNFVRKGILVMAEEKTRAESTQMERWRFCFPREFMQFLPPVIQSPHVFNAPGNVQTAVARKKLFEDVREPEGVTDAESKRFAIRITHGTLYMGKEPFRAAALADWQQEMWLKALAITMPNDPATLSPVKAVQVILETLSSEQWAVPEQLEEAIKIFCFGARPPGAAKILGEGWQWGCLARHIDEGKMYYRLPTAVLAQSDGEGDPADYLKPAEKAGRALVDLHTIPMTMLEQLNTLARMEASQGQLAAFPDPVKLERAAPEARQSPLARWLREHVSAFGQMLETIEERWGKVIIHSDLLVARVRDLSLRVQLERELGENLVVLGKEYVAFPVDVRSAVERLLKKTGFVIKEVKA